MSIIDKSSTFYRLNLTYGDDFIQQASSSSMGNDEFFYDGKQILLQSGEKVTIRIPDNDNYGSKVFTKFIHFTITLKREGA